MAPACLAAEPETLADCEALLRVARYTIESHFGPEDWPGAALHLIDAVHWDLSGPGRP